MSQLPTVGRIVHYYPGTTDTQLSDKNGTYNNNGADVLPAIVLQTFGYSTANLLVFCTNTDTHLARRYSVPHKTELHATLDSKIQQAHWEWPPHHTAPVIPVPATIIEGEFTKREDSGDITFKKFSDDNRA